VTTPEPTGTPPTDRPEPGATSPGGVPLPPPPGAPPPAPDAPAPGDAMPSGGASSPPGGQAVPADGGAGWDRRSSATRGQPGLVLGIILVIVGGALLIGRVTDITIGPDAWPLWIVVPGVAMLLGSFAIPPRGGVGLAIPGAIVTTVGLILWFQESYDAYATWAYAWALVAPTAVGVGMLLYGLVRGDRELVGDGLRTALVGLALFAGFALFFEGVIGLSGEPVENLDEVLPYAVIGLGLLLVVMSFLGGGERRRRRRREQGW
jgi:hypothetical protein